MSDLYLRISDKAYIEQKVDLGHEYSLQGTITIESEKKKPDEEGGFDYTFTSKFTGAIELKKGNEVIKGKEKGRQSQLNRAATWHLQNEVENQLEREEFYNQFMGAFRRHMREVYEIFKSEIK